MDPKAFVQTLESTLGNQLRSVSLYGSRAAGDFVDRRSDYNLLVVVDELSLPTLKRLQEPVSAWVDSGQPAPMLFTEKRLRQSADVFAIELYDLRDSRQTLFGEDLVAQLELSPSHLRLQLEAELKAKLISLREGYFACGGRKGELTELVIASLSNFLTLIRAALRLSEGKAPAAKEAAVDLLASHMAFDAEPFHQAAQLKSGSLSPKAVDGEDLYGRYLAAVEQLVDAIDAHQI